MYMRTVLPVKSTCARAGAVNATAQNANAVVLAAALPLMRHFSQGRCLPQRRVCR
jgi:hypothetical protein